MSWFDVMIPSRGNLSAFPDDDPAPVYRLKITSDRLKDIQVLRIERNVSPPVTIQEGDTGNGTPMLSSE